MSNPSVGSYWWMVESPVAPWNGAQTLLRVHALNERCLEILAQMARMDRERIGLDIVNLYRSQWRSLNTTGRKCAARTPFLLVDIHLHDADWWRWARTPRLIRRRDTVRHGSARVYVLWTEARTPDDVVVPLASPGTDELGRAGLPGEVNRHFWERFGAATFVSVIDGAVQAAVQRASDGGDGTVVVNPSTSRDIMTEVLRSTINIPPTVTKQNGDRIAVLVARDLDFRSVYELRPVALQR